MKRVPMTAPCAPSASAATTPRPSTMPPAATTGILTASTIWGTSASVPISPGGPPRPGPRRGNRVRRRRLGAARVCDLAGHHHDRDPVTLHLGDVLLRYRKAGDEHLDALVEEHRQERHDHLRDGREEIDREG